MASLGNQARLTPVSHASTEPKQNRTRLIVILAALLVIIGLAVYAVTRPTGPAAGPPVSSPSASGSAGSAQPAPASPKSVPADCTAVTEGFVPTRYVIERLGVDEPIVALDLDDKGNIAAPPKDEPRLASWWSGGPQPGADKGKAILSIHTYRNGNALGNELFKDGASQFKPGDILKVYGQAGQVQCYSYADATKINIADYDPESSVMIDYDGAPSLTIIICWDFVASTEEWDSRVFFNFVPIKP